jgi:PIN domain nuclease of toxin-antitoxin system
MRLLVDAHTLLWWLDDPALLSEAARSAIRDARNDVLVSAATIWEIVIKQALGKLQAPDDLQGAISSCRFATLPITVSHALAVRGLPAIHRDPFDRMLVAQAMVEHMEIAARDPVVPKYPVRCIVA